MAESFTGELHDIIDRAYVECGGRATAAQLHASVYGSLPHHLTDYLIGKGLRSQVSGYFREKDADGLPKRPEANGGGEHVQQEFLSVTEFAYVHSTYLARSKANADQADRVRQKCLDVHGVDLAAHAIVV